MPPEMIVYEEFDCKEVRWRTVCCVNPVTSSERVRLSVLVGVVGIVERISLPVT